jgi:hypothetical protein
MVVLKLLCVKTQQAAELAGSCGQAAGAVHHRAARLVYTWRSHTCPTLLGNKLGYQSNRKAGVGLGSAPPSQACLDTCVRLVPHHVHRTWASPGQALAGCARKP